MGTLEIKMLLADAIRETDRARGRVALYANNLRTMRIDLRDARQAFTRRREHERELRRELRTAERQERQRVKS